MIALLLATLAFGSETFGTSTYYWGDLHAHTGISPDGYDSEDDAGTGPQAPTVIDCLRTSEVCGSLYTPTSVYQTAITNGLDFVALTDHAESIAGDWFDLLQDGLDNWDGPPDSTHIVVIPSAELHLQGASSVGTPKLGHKDIFFFDDDNSKFDTLALDTDISPLDTNILAGLTADCSASISSTVSDLELQGIDATHGFGNILMWAHHETANEVMTTNWSCTDISFEPVVEVYDGWGNALTDDPTYDPPHRGTEGETVDVPYTAASIEDALQGGSTSVTLTIHGTPTSVEYDWDPLRVGFVGGTDLHDTRPGMTCDRTLTAPTNAHQYGGAITMLALPNGVDLKRSEIYNQLVARATYVSTGPEIPVLTTWHSSATGTDYNIGSEIPFSTATGNTTTVTVSVPSADEGHVSAVTLIGSGTTSIALTESTTPGTWSKVITNTDLPAWLYVQVSVNTDRGVLYAGACADGGADTAEYIWSSPVWFDLGPANDSDLDGYLTTDSNPDCNDSDPAVNPGATEVCDDVDNDCDESIDETTVAAPIGGSTLLYRDRDGDGYGFDSPANISSCDVPVPGYSSNALDCVDTARGGARYHPGAAEAHKADGLDFNCNCPTSTVLGQACDLN